MESPILVCFIYADIVYHFSSSCVCLCCVGLMAAAGLWLPSPLLDMERTHPAPPSRYGEYQSVLAFVSVLHSQEAFVEVTFV